MNPQAVLALCHEHARAEAEFDIDRVLATLIPTPRYEFFPLAMSISGWANIELFYRHQYPKFVALVEGYQLLGEWTNDGGALQEYVIDLGQDDGTTAAYRVLSMMPVDGESGLLTGERLYCDEGFVRALLGPLYDLLEPGTGS
jgi:hypothetical protein